jgi:hypothetical protein
MRALVIGVVVLTAAGVVRADPKEELATVDVRNLTKAVEAYTKARGMAPAKLMDLVTAGIVDPKATLLDPWGNPYQYDAKGKKNGGKRPDIWAVTPDRRQIGNWPEQKDG